MTEDCDCLSFGTDDTGHFVCIDCGEALFPNAAPLDAATLEMGRQAQREHDASYTPLSPFTYRQ